MAIEVVNSQGVKLWLLPQPTTPWQSCGEAITALQGGAIIECPQSLGEVAETRQVEEYKCFSSDESAKALGAISRTSFEAEVLLNPVDTAGQQLLRKSFRNDIPLIMGIEYNGVVLYFNIAVSAVGTAIAQDSAITTKFTIEISSNIKECSTLNLASYPIVNNGISIINNGIPVVNTH